VVNSIYADFPQTGIWDAATRYRSECTYANGVKMILQNAEGQHRMGAKWIGTEGWVWVDRGGFDASPKSLLKPWPGASLRLNRQPSSPRGLVRLLTLAYERGY
jgi:hypothetical protein